MHTVPRSQCGSYVQLVSYFPPTLLWKHAGIVYDRVTRATRATDRPLPDLPRVELLLWGLRLGLDVLPHPSPRAINITNHCTASTYLCRGW
jgi:hypothetical protein